MNCPVCSKSLEAQTVADVTLDVCSQGCGGIWFDQFEFKKFDEKKEPDPAKKLKLPQGKSGAAHSDELHHCPKCANIPMMRYFSSVKRHVVIDQCPQCAGVWVDPGELSGIRDEFDTESERMKAADAVFSELFDGQIAAAKQQSQEKLATLQAMGRVVRFLSPSYVLRRR